MYLTRKALSMGLFAALSVAGFGQSPKGDAWRFERKIDLDGLGVVGMAADAEGNLYLAATDENLLLHLHPDGRRDTLLQDLDRPMHLSQRNGVLYIAEYGADRILVLHDGHVDTLGAALDLDAPSGVDMLDGQMAIADFYKHRVVLSSAEGTKSIGGKGKEKGQFDYPTDVAFAEGKLWVADAYNHRVQVFDMHGKPLRVIGANDKMNAATGIHVEGGSLFVTDFENSRVLIYNLKGRLQQILQSELDKPSDVVIVAGKLYVLNYRGQFISVFHRGIQHEN